MRRDLLRYSGSAAPSTHAATTPSAGQAVADRRRRGPSMPPGRARPRGSAPPGGIDRGATRRDPRAAECHRRPDRAVGAARSLVEPARPGRREPRTVASVAGSNELMTTPRHASRPERPRAARSGASAASPRSSFSSTSRKRRRRAGGQHVGQAGNAERGRARPRSAGTHGCGVPGRGPAMRRGGPRPRRRRMRGRPARARRSGDRERSREGRERVLRRRAVVAPVGQQEHAQPPGVAARSGPVIGMANEKRRPDSPPRTPPRSGRRAPRRHGGRSRGRARSRRRPACAPGRPCRSARRCAAGRPAGCPARGPRRRPRPRVSVAVTHGSRPDRRPG